MPRVTNGKANIYVHFCQKLPSILYFHLEITDVFQHKSLTKLITHYLYPIFHFIITYRQKFKKKLGIIWIKEQQCKGSQYLPWTADNGTCPYIIQKPADLIHKLEKIWIDHKNIYLFYNLINYITTYSVAIFLGWYHWSVTTNSTSYSWLTCYILNLQ
jgi:hypothetical protein